MNYSFVQTTERSQQESRCLSQTLINWHKLVLK